MICGARNWFARARVEAECTEPEGHEVLDTPHRDKWEGLEWPS